ncbi:hypothetical protein HMPREF2738_01343 [Clostridiales bacterium KLE1615]|nr:hypothetical protein HMPREF2738_01343 [Clostridiales bacterium KLE1615]
MFLFLFYLYFINYDGFYAQLLYFLLRNQCFYSSFAVFFTNLFYIF